ncbi:MAG: type IV pilus assembly protein PilM [Patescibacteria group bacterium]|nr:type IV pilus assembly protein PilM [Patescibacteria group bacterium]
MSFSLSHIFSKEVRSVIGVDIGSSSIKVVQLRRERGRAILETYGAIALGPYTGVEVGRATQLPADKISEALKEVIKEANVTTVDAGIAIPYASSLVSVVRLPASLEDRLAQTMPLEARKYIPVPINEVQLDWILVGGGKESGNVQDKLEVMLVAIHNDTIAKYRQIALDSALSASFFEIEVFSAVRASLDHGIAPVAVVDFGAATTKFYVVERGIVRESHIINQGSQELTLNASRALNITVAQAEERKRKMGLDRASAPAGVIPGSATMTASDAEHSFELSLAPILSEISRTQASFEARMGESISTIVFTGGGSTLKGFREFSQSKLQAEVRLADPFGKTEAPAFLEGILKEAGPEFSVAVGLALRRLQELG